MASQQALHWRNTYTESVLGLMISLTRLRTSLRSPASKVQMKTLRWTRSPYACKIAETRARRLSSLMS
jgi:hypothetical protein